MQKFSVLMSVYIKENDKFFDTSLKSVFNQTVMPTEVVIVKDGPLTKELDKVISKYKKLYSDIIKVVAFKENRGLGPALADGIKECSYDIVARMDTDDICNKTRFEKQLKVLENDKILIVGSNVEEYDENMDKLLSIKKVPETNEEIIKYAKKRNPFNHMSVMFRKNAVLECGNYENVSYFEDYYLWCKLLKMGEGYNIQENLVNVRAGDSMIKRRGGLSYIKCIFSFESKILKLGTINLFEMIIFSCFRSIISIAPVNFRRNFYKKFLRKRKDS